MTPKEREVMQMALDALEGCYPDKAAQSMAQIDAAVALRTALAAPSEELELPKVRLWEFLELIKDKEDFRGIPIMRTEWPTREEALAADEPSANRLTQPEQEPVAWMSAHDPTDLYYRKPLHPDAIPLYTAPPQREWQGLTDEEYATLMQQADYDAAKTGSVFQNLRRAIEAKLREKNRL